MVPIETEVKMTVPETVLEETRARFRWRCLHPRTLEDNWLWDRPDGTLRSRGELLRLRQYGDQVTLTWKGQGNRGDNLKRRPELEVVVADRDVIHQILERLGFIVWFRYQKFRTLYAYEDVHIAVDETPIGIYVELEGDAETIWATIARFGWEGFSRTTATYYDLFVEAVRDGRWREPMLVFSGR